ncbi:MAG: oligosaccharide flippase family protein [Patescibacteria group bacterium]
MSSGKTIVKNTLWLTTGEVASRLMMFFLTILIARRLGDVIFGQYSYILAYVTLFSFIPDFGIYNLVCRELARQKEKTAEYLSKIIPLKVILGLGTIGVIAATITLFGNDPEINRLIILATLFTILFSFSELFWAVYRAFEKMKYEAIAYILERVFIIGFSLYAIFGPVANKLGGIILAYVLANIILFLLNFTFIQKRFARFRLKIDPRFWSKILSESWPFALSTVFITIYFSLDSVMLGKLKGDEVVGWYNAAYRIIFFLLIFINTVAKAVYPVISRLYTENQDRLSNFVDKYAKLMTIIALPLGFGGTLLGSKIIILIFGQEYTNGILAFQILIWSVVIMTIRVVCGRCLQACNQAKMHLASVGIGAGANILLNIILIPRFSLNGAAVATVASELVVFLVMYWRVQKFLKIRFFRYTAKSLIASLVMVLGLSFIIQLNLFILIILGTIVYFAAMLLIKGIDKNDLAAIKEVIGSRN